jgi:hypothetical protein
MVLLIDENVPDSVTNFFVERGHEVILVREALPAGTADQVVAAVGDRLSELPQISRTPSIGEMMRFGGKKWQEESFLGSSSSRRFD